MTRLWVQDRVNERIKLLKNQLCLIVYWLPPAQFIHQQTTESLDMSKGNKGASLRTGAGLLINPFLSSDDLESQWLAPLMKTFDFSSGEERGIPLLKLISTDHVQTLSIWPGARAQIFGWITLTVCLYPNETPHPCGLALHVKNCSVYSWKV